MEQCSSSNKVDHAFQEKKTVRLLSAPLKIFKLFGVNIPLRQPSSWHSHISVLCLSQDRRVMINLQAKH